jgi:sterol desaturase/sphingolipid hydroxylase (fatty acid hydroxylase superfamily)
MTFLENYADRVLFIISAALIFMPLERLFPRFKVQLNARRDMKLDLLYMFVAVILLMALSMIFIVSVVSGLGWMVPEAAKTFVSSQPIWIQVALLIIFGDFYYYWVHRLFHTVPLLWKFHSIHHSIEHMDWIAASRTHPIDTALTNSGVIIIAILFEFSGLAVLIFGIQFSWHSWLKHSNVMVGWGPLRWLLLTPTFHHWHHANVKEAYDKNFSGQLPLWDILFGTAIMNEKNGPDKYGVDDPVPVTFIRSLIYPFDFWRTGEAEIEYKDASIIKQPVPDQHLERSAAIGE